MVPPTAASNMEELPFEDLFLLVFLFLFQQIGRVSMRHWWTFWCHFLTYQRLLMEEEEEEEDIDMEDLNLLMLLVTLGIATDGPYVDQPFWSRATSTDLWVTLSYRLQITTSGYRTFA